MAVLLVLRTIICMGTAFLVWFVSRDFAGFDSTLLSVLVPVWLGGLVGGVVACVFSVRQGLMMAFVSGVLLTIGFLYVRHGISELPLGPDTMVTLWPLWFPAAFYVGAYGYLSVMLGRSQ